MSRRDCPLCQFLCGTRRTLEHINRQALCSIHRDRSQAELEDLDNANQLYIETRRSEDYADSAFLQPRTPYRKKYLGRKRSSCL